MTRSGQPEMEVFSTSEQLSAALAERVAALAAAALAARGEFRIAIPGGSVAGLLAGGFAGQAADVGRWDWFWVDERCVAREDPRSNAGEAERAWLSRLAVPRERLHAMDGGRGPEAGARDYEAELGRVSGTGPGEWPRLDLVVLGLGEDGHVASLFPGHPALEETRRWVVPVHNAPKPPPERITMTLPLLNHAREVWVVAAGAAKAAAVARARGGGSGDAALPVQRLHPMDGEVRWRMDRAAAGLRVGEEET